MVVTTSKDMWHLLQGQARDAAEHRAINRMPLAAEKDPVQNVSGAKFEKPCLEYSVCSIRIWKGSQ